MDPAEAGDLKPKRRGWVAELRGLFFVLLGVIGIQSLAAKPFYIPSESMMPTLLTGDRLIVSKYPYGWSYASLPIHVVGFMPGRLLGRLPERGDVVIVVRRGDQSDLIKRVIGLPGDTIAVRHGIVILNGRPLHRSRRPDAMVPVDANAPCTAGPLASHRFQAPDGNYSADCRSIAKACPAAAAMM